MARGDTRFRCQDFGGDSEKQVFADFPSSRGRDCATRRDQFARSGFAQADLAGRTRHLSRQRSLELLTGRSGQSLPGRLQSARRNALVFIEQNAGRASAKLAGWPNQNVSDAGSAAFSERSCRSFSKWKLFATARERNFCRLLPQLCATIGSRLGNRRRPATLIKDRFSANRRSLE